MSLWHFLRVTEPKKAEQVAFKLLDLPKLTLVQIFQGERVVLAIDEHLILCFLTDF